MPYVSKEVRERAKWLDLGRLEALVCAAEACSQDEPREQIVRALGDGAIWPLRWDPEPASPPYRGSGVRLSGHPPPSRGSEDWRILDHWRVVKLDWERSRVFDDFERAAYPALRKLWRDDDPMVGSDNGYSSRARPHAPPKPRRSVWRQLLLDRAACEAIWPPRAAEREASEALRAELRRLPEALTELRASVQTAVRTRQAPDVPADVVAEKMQQARVGVDAELIGCLARDQLAVFLDTSYGLERLPWGEYWLRPDGSPQPEATRAFISGTASSIRHRNAAGIVMVRSDDFRAFGAQYLGAHGLADPPKNAEPAILVPDQPDSRKPVTRRPSRQKPFWPVAGKAAFAWLDESGFPSPGDGGQAKLEDHIAGWLTVRGHGAAESTIRKHVRDWIEDFKASLSARD